MNFSKGGKQQQNGGANVMNSPQQLKKHFQPLNESEKQEVQINEIFQIEENRFTFESGTFMGNMDVPLNIPFSLWYHAKNTNSLAEFMKSVELFLEKASVKLTEVDKSNLRVEYARFK